MAEAKAASTPAPIIGPYGGPVGIIAWPQKGSNLPSSWVVVEKSGRDGSFLPLHHQNTSSTSHPTRLLQELHDLVVWGYL